MTVLSKTEELAGIIRESREFQNFEDSLKRIRQEESAFVILQKYRALQMSLHLSALKGEEYEEETEAFEEVCEVMGEDKLLADYLAAEFSLNCLLQDVHETLYGGLEIQLDFDGEVSSESLLLN